MNASIRNLLLSNAATLVAALVFHWTLGSMLWSYWIQSVIIGWYARHRMLALSRFSTQGFSSNGHRVAEDGHGKRSTANFFTLHYGFFHLVYLGFLLTMHPLANWKEMFVLAACGASFALSQRETFATQHAADLRGKPNLGTMMFTPYLRVVPVHVAMVYGADGGLGTGMTALTLFAALKTAADLFLDRIDRHIAVRSAEKHAPVTPAESSP